MTDLSHTQSLDTARATIAAKTAAYEAEFGPVQTLPIFVGERPKQTFFIQVPGKPKSAGRYMPVARRKAPAERKPRPNMLAKRAKLERLRELAALGYSIDRMVEATHYPRSWITRALWDPKNEIVRGQQARMA